MTMWDFPAPHGGGQIWWVRMRRAEAPETTRADPGKSHTPADSAPPNLPPRPAQGAGDRPDAPDPGPRLCGSPARAAPPAAKPPRVLITALGVRGCGGPVPPARTPAASCSLRRPRAVSRGVASSRQPGEATRAGAVGRGPQPARQSCTPGSQGQGTTRRTLGTARPRSESWVEPLGDFTLCRRCSSPSPCCAARSSSGTRRSLVPALTCTHLGDSWTSGGPGAAAARPSCPQVPRSTARWSGSAGPRLCEQPRLRAQRRLPAASLQPLGSSGPPAGPAPAPPRPAGGPAPLRPGTLGSVGAAPPPLRLRAPAAAPTDCKFRQAASPAHEQMGHAAAAFHSHSWVSAELSPWPGWWPGSLANASS